MRKNHWIVLALFLVLPALLFTVSCAKKEVMADPEMAQRPTRSALARRSA